MMPAYSFGEVILVPFPFTDQTGTKKRPAVIASNAAYNQERRDVVIMAITSQRPAAAHEALMQDWQAAGLLKSSVIKPVMGGKTYLLRAMVNETTDPPVVVTVYRTSQIDKYWSQT